MTETSPPVPKPSLMGQAVAGSAYTIAATAVTIVLGFARSTLLARCVAPEAFGVLAMALFLNGLRSSLTRLGLTTALVHRQDADAALERTAFACLFGLEAISIAALLASLPLIRRAYPEMPELERLTYILAPTYLAAFLNQVQAAHLRKALSFKRLAQLDVIASVTMTATAVPAALWGWGLNALVIEQISGLAVRFILTWGPWRAWKPGFAWDREHLRWLWGYGRPTWVASNLSYLLEHFDDFWVGTSLGQAALGHYTRAYDYAHYPRRLVANPLASVLGPVFAAAQDDRLLLSRLFYRAMFFVWRAALLVAGFIALVMPEFIEYIIGPQWGPMLLMLRLMLLYTVLDSLLLLVSILILYLGKPQYMQRSTIIQTAVFVPAVILGSRLWQANGVALAADLMLVVGALCLVRPVRSLVDISLQKLLLWPALLALIGLASALLLESSLAQGLWLGLVTKTVVFVVIFGLGVLLIERRDVISAVGWLLSMARPRRGGPRT